MMADHRTEYTPTERIDGLIFDWRNPRSSRLAKMAILAATLGIFVFLFSIIRITMGQPPIQEVKSASAMMLFAGNDPMDWAEQARALGPFPTRFDPVDWGLARDLFDQSLGAALERTTPVSSRRFLDFPGESRVPQLPLVSKGSRVLPRVAPPELPVMSAATGVRTTPVLYPLGGAMDALPESTPAFVSEVSPAMASQLWRFLLQVSPEGVVQHAVAMVGHNTPGRVELAEWLESHRFPTATHGRDRWVAVALTFQNQPLDGTDDP